MQQKQQNKLGKSSWLRHPRKELAALALKPGRAKALRRHLRMFRETSLSSIIIAIDFPVKLHKILQGGNRCNHKKRLCVPTESQPQVPIKCENLCWHNVASPVKACGYLRRGIGPKKTGKKKGCKRTGIIA
ncbi:hypothetical protein VPH35_079893 [Triticum aestivum]|uniref:Uncharacterized protein n=1 Tax=Aegilops tauschii subsp. strangulata TaxID=200361 RepID=A0A453J212_AEGTS